MTRKGEYSYVWFDVEQPVRGNAGKKGYVTPELNSVSLNAVSVMERVMYESVSIPAHISLPASLLRYKREDQLNWEESDLQSSFGSHSYSAQYKNTRLVRQQPSLLGLTQEAKKGRTDLGSEVRNRLLQQARLG
jgi:hypothetical protein